MSGYPFSFQYPNPEHVDIQNTLTVKEGKIKYSDIRSPEKKRQLEEKNVDQEVKEFKRLGIDVKELLDPKDIKLSEYPSKKIPLRFGRLRSRVSSRQLESKYKVILRVINQNLPDSIEQLSKREIDKLIDKLKSKKYEEE